jgi:AcrR family transcriptional regulator
VRTGKAEELSGLTDDLTDWILSVAHEEVVAFYQLRVRPTERGAGGRLPARGGAGASRGAVADAARRAVTATARLAATNGLAGLTSAKIRKDAGLSRSEFDRLFSGVEDCFLDAVESVASMAAQAADASAENVEGWEKRTFKKLRALCSLAADDRDLSRLVLLDVMAPGRAGLLRREELIERAATRLCDQAPPERRPSPLAANASVSAVWRIAETEVAAGRTTQLPRLAPVFVYMILAARRGNSRSESSHVPDPGPPVQEVGLTPLAVSAA